MASPQIEEGYTKIANELLEALAKIRIPGEARQVLDVVLRKTYGFNKKSDAIALSQFVGFTGLTKVAVCKAIKKLLQIEVITQKGNAIAKEYALNKHYDKWKPLPKKVILPKKVMTITQKGNPALPNWDTTKETITKETITKERGSDMTTVENSCLLNHEENYPPPEKATGIHAALLTALNKLQVSPEEIAIAEKLLSIGCEYQDIEAARKLKNKNSLKYLQNVVCEMRDIRTKTEEIDDNPFLRYSPSTD